MKAAPLVALSALVLAGIGATHLIQAPKQEPPAIVIEMIVEHVDVPSPLERARQASFDLSMPLGAGSAVLVSRVNLENGGYRYRAITAQHVIEEITDDINTNGENANLEIIMTFQPEFHGPQLQITTDVEAIEWTVPANDWAVFTFVSNELLECADVATREEFEAISAWDPIYFIASFGPYGPQCRQGVIATTHNVGAYPSAQLTSPLPWNQQPENFFRFSMPIWYGDSGGPIFDQHGRLIGIGNAFTVSSRGGFGPGQQVTHSGVGLKTYLIREMVIGVDENFFKIED